MAQPSDTPRLRKFYNSLKDSGAVQNVPDFDTFQKKLSDPENRRKFHASLRQNPLMRNVPDYKRFNAQVFGDTGPKADTTTPKTRRQPPTEFQTPTGFSKGAATEAGMADHVAEFANSFARSAMQGVGATVEGLGTLADQLRRKVGDLGPRVKVGEGPESTQSIFKSIGKSIERTAQEWFPDDPDTQNNFVNTTLPSAFGSTVSFLTAGAAGGTPAAAITGMFQMGQRGFEDAKRNGANDDTAFKSFLFNMPIGGLEALPIGKVLNRANKVTGGGVSKVLAEGAVGGFEELAQETTSQFLSNVTATQLYDKSRDLLQGTGEGGAAGFITGAFLSSIGAKVGQIRNDPNSTPEDLRVAKQTERLLRDERSELFEDTDGDVEGAIPTNVEQIFEIGRLEERQTQQTETTTEQTEQTEQAEETTEEAGAEQETFASFEFDEGADPQTQIQQLASERQRLQQRLEEEDLSTAEVSEIESVMEQIDEKQNEISRSTGAAPARLDDTAAESDPKSKRRGRPKTRENKAGFNADFLKKLRENTNQFFKSVSNKRVRDQAKAWVDSQVEQLGLDGAVNAARKIAIQDEANLSFTQRTAIGMEVIGRLEGEYVNLAENNDPEAVNINDKKLRFSEDFDARASDMGRSLQLLSYGQAYQPHDFVRIYERGIKEFNEGSSASAKSARFIHERLLGKSAPEVSEEVRTEIIKRAEDMKNTPEGTFRDEKTQDLFRYIDRHLPTNIGDMAVATGYANILSSHETQAVNFFNTGMNVLFDAITLNIANPGATKEIWTGLYTGFKAGTEQAKAAVRGRRVRGQQSEAKGIEEINPLEQLARDARFEEGDTELQRIGKAAAKIPGSLRWVRRIMVASDVMWYRSANEMRQNLLARKIAENEGVTDPDKISTRVNEIMHQTAEQKQAALEQAREEGFSGRDAKRRQLEIIEQNRPDDVVLNGKQFADKSRYTQEPEGVLGEVTKGIERITERVPPLKMVVPFTRVVANVSNNLIDYSPLGYTRLFAATKWGGKIKNVPEGDLWTQQAAKASLGTLAMGLPAMMNAMNMEDDEPGFYIHGRGPQNFTDRYQLQETGWKPHSIQIGENFISYEETIFALPFSLVGNYFDAVKYDELNQESVTSRVAYAMNSAPKVIMKQNFLKGVEDLFTSLSRENLVDDTSPVVSAINAVRPFAIPNIVKKVDQIFDPRVFTDDNIKEALARDLPWARQSLSKPMLNVLGEPIRNDWELSDRVASRFVTTKQDDPVWQTLTGKNAFVSTPQQGNTKITLPNGDTRDLNPTEFYNFTILRGRYLRNRLERSLSFIEEMPDGQAQQYVSELSADATTYGKRALLQRNLIGSDETLEPNEN